MAQLPVEIIDLRTVVTPDLSLALERANQVQQELLYLQLGSEYSDALRLNVRRSTQSGSFFEALSIKKREWRGFHPYIVVVIDSVLSSARLGNLFATRRGEEGLAIVTSFGLEGIVVPSGRMAAYYLYELASHTLAFIVAGKQHHRETRGCVFDLKEDKRQIMESMKAGALCDECRAWFEENGKDLSPSQLAAIDTLLHYSSLLLNENEPAPRPGPVKPRVFVGSSIEGLEVARALQSELQYDYLVEVWNQNTVFGLGTAKIEALERGAKTYQYAVFVFTADDQIARRDESRPVPRDNVVFEAGLFIGSLSRFRAFIVCPRGVDLQLPSDFAGLTLATYDPTMENLDAAIGPACRQIRTAIAQSG